MNLGTFSFFFLSVMLLMEGCIMVPVPTKQDRALAGKPVTEAQLSFLTPKITTMEEVVERLGNPNIIWEDARVFVYHWDMRQGILFWAVAGQTAGAGMEDIPKHYLLLIRFDEQSRVVRFTRTARPLLQPLADFLQQWLQNSDDDSQPDTPIRKELRE
ncbi:MAG: hypothetical protein RBR01_05265 [Desulfobacterales bacterium]|jgi:outer membrane protein assembly factor BamE (lipoprotein component of BamABCDE complex)|nr:hypothetical protein [Desulfobacterales bacterium]MDD3081091.1 hypothetical protein [Desulfobacterales bacterium]MDD3950218.1 hypothetical protein [Desulfobacterales bacterium]MDD4463635.1 hypothetical protein [Desulfobacterales bacterium]MDY0377827.1 hypothetical protein [Desulfobacterales bacterium]